MDYHEAMTPIPSQLKKKHKIFFQVVRQSVNQSISLSISQWAIIEPPNNMHT